MNGRNARNARGNARVHSSACCARLLAVAVGPDAHVPGFFANAATRRIAEQVAGHSCVPRPGCRIGASVDHCRPFEEKMTRLTDEFAERVAEAAYLEAETRVSLGRVGYGL